MNKKLYGVYFRIENVVRIQATSKEDAEKNSSMIFKM